MVQTFIAGGKVANGVAGVQSQRLGNPAALMFQQGHQQTGVDAKAVGDKLKHLGAEQQPAFYLFLVCRKVTAERGGNGLSIEVGRSRTIDQFAVGNNFEIRPGSPCRRRNKNALADIENVVFGQAVNLHQLFHGRVVKLGQVT